MIFPATDTSRKILDVLRLRLNSALVGKSEVIEMVMACVLAQGHLLFDDLPGLGKTTLAKALASSIGGKYSRCLLYTSPSPRDATLSRMPSSA